MTTYQNACSYCGAHSGQPCRSRSTGNVTGTHVSRTDPARLQDAPRVERTIVVKGIELPWARRRYNGGYYKQVAGQESRVWTEHPMTIESGTAFVSYTLLDELSEADNSWGAGGAFLVNDPRAQAALECAGLVTVETRGGVYTTTEQRAMIAALLRREYG